MEAIKERLRQLKLSGACKSLETRIDYAQSKKVSYLDFLELLLEDEWVVRQNNAYQRRLVQSRLSQQKRMDNYDFTMQPELDKSILMDLCSCRFINLKQNVILMGNPGVGKTHLANAIGLEALKNGHSVMFIHANSLIDQLNRSKADGSYYTLLKKLGRINLLILDEVGFKRFPQNGIDDFFEVIRQRYESGSTIVTTNRNFEDWGQLFGDKVMASAIIDRLVYHAFIIKIKGESYRIKNTEKTENK
jgi:DNA replication protein DnaC